MNPGGMSISAPEAFPKFFNLTRHLMIVQLEMNDVEKRSISRDPGGPYHEFGNLPGQLI
jgi:hypothetical protein